MRRLPVVSALLLIAVYSGVQPQSVAVARVKDGGRPLGDLTLDGSTLFGTTSVYEIGFSGGGKLFSINTDGTGFMLLHDFEGGTNDGEYPFGELTLSGSTLYGTTRSGGSNNQGIIFALNTDGAGYAILHEFAGGANDGGHPLTNLALNGSTLYGTTYGGGDSDLGTIFSIGTDGTGFTLLHEFAGGLNDGSRPIGNVTLNGTSLFGTSSQGGDSDRGTVFSIHTDGTDFTLLHEFAGEAYDGSNPYAGVSVNGSALYGTTYGGGGSDLGTIFSLNSDGTAFTLLHEFAGGDDDGSRPHAELNLSGSTILGTSEYGGGLCDSTSLGCGTVFSISTDGSAFELLHKFAGGEEDGRTPSAGVVLSGSALFGVTAEGGDRDLGTIYSLNSNGNGYTLLHEFSGVIPEPSCLVLLLTGGCLTTLRRRACSH